MQCTPIPGNVTNLVQWLEECIERLQDIPDFIQLTLITIFSTLWQIWKNRNSFVFDHKQVCPVSTLIQANILIADYNSFQMKQGVQPRHVPKG